MPLVFHEYLDLWLSIKLVQKQKWLWSVIVFQRVISVVWCNDARRLLSREGKKLSWSSELDSGLSYFKNSEDRGPGVFTDTFFDIRYQAHTVSRISAKGRVPLFFLDHFMPFGGFLNFLWFFKIGDHDPPAIVGWNCTIAFLDCIQHDRQWAYEFAESYGRNWGTTYGDREIATSAWGCAFTAL